MSAYAGSPGRASDPDAVALGFVDALRAAGVAVSVAEAQLFVRALTEVGMTSAQAVWAAGRVTLVKQRSDLARYDAAFDAYWFGADGASVVTDARRQDPVDRDRADEAEGVDPTAAGGDPVRRAVAEHGEDAADPEPDDDEDDAPAATVVRATSHEVLRSRDFATCTPDELAELRRLVTLLRVRTDLRRSRRRRPARGRHPRGDIDLRRTLQWSRATDGEIVRFARSRPRPRPRRLVLLVDISGSMEDYARALVRFAHAATTSGTQVETFTLGTRLTRITRALATVDPDAALDRAAASVEDWSGGTRLGLSLKQFNDEWGVRGMARGATVVVLSDGWERGDPEDLAREMARLSRVTHRIVWVNPLKASPGYEPVARGMARSLPFIDDFVDGHSFDALQSLAALIARPASGGRGRA